MARLSVLASRTGKPFVFKPRSAFEPSAFQAQGRRRLWDLSANLHCSIIGTCLSTGELRRIVVKIRGEAARSWSDHAIHKEGVTMAHDRSGAGKLLQKALDERHSGAIRRFHSAQTSAEIVAKWREARAEGDIPGAYWAALTHPRLAECDLREIFGDVHMLSHLVGAANRADIRRLAKLEADNAALREKIDRQQARIARQALASAADAVQLERLTTEAREAPVPVAALEPGSTEVIGRLQRKLDREIARRSTLQEQMNALRAESETIREEAATAREIARRCGDELVVLERLLVERSEPDPEFDASALTGVALLYVGGRAHLRAALITTAARVGATLLVHDGGLEETGTHLPRLVAHADHVFFPVDCVSHDAVNAVKRACRQTNTDFTPLPSSGLGSFARSLQELALMRERKVYA